MPDPQFSPASGGDAVTMTSASSLEADWNAWIDRARALAARQQERRTAVHEAAHAVVAVLLDLHVNRIVLHETGEGSCLVTSTAVPALTREDVALVARAPSRRPVDPYWRQPSIVVATVVQLLAGRVAEERLLDACAPEGAGVDEDLARRVLARALRTSPDAPDVTRQLPLFALRAETLVRAEWAWIARVADALIAQRSLVLADILALEQGVSS